jgi:lipid-A-disaccharide synthase
MPGACSAFFFQVVLCLNYFTRMKLYLIAGEASGDLHCSNLLKALYHEQPDAICRAWGGDLMQAAGATVVKHYRELAFMGFVEVLRNLGTILRNLSWCKKDILAFKPDALVLIDYPGFNLRIAKWARHQGIPVIYYISPQIWAWHRSRVHSIRRDVDLMLVILPFEKAFYEQYGVSVAYVGHPLLDAIQNMKPGTATLPDFPKNTIALLPGSRVQEVKRILPRMLSITGQFPAYHFVVAGTHNLPESFYASFLAGHPNVQLVQGQTYALLQQSVAALVKSGTSTLEAALLDAPQVVCYTGSPVSYQIARRLVQVKYISLVNLVADKPLVQELIQDDLNPANLKSALENLLDPTQAAAMRRAYGALRQLLGEGGASARAAAEILAFLANRPVK